MKGLILSAGAHPDLAPINATTPIGALPLAGRPILAHQLETMARLGITEVMVVLHHLPYAIEKTLQAYAPEGVRVRVALEREIAGTAAALRTHVDFISETTLVVLGDIVHDLELLNALEHHRAAGALLTAVLSRTQAHHGGLAELDANGRLTAFTEQSGSGDGLVSTGVYWIEPGLPWLVPQSPCELGRDLLPRLIAADQVVCGYEVQGYWQDAGTPQGYWRAQMDWLSDGVYVDPLAKVHPQAKLVAPCYVGPGCEVAREAEVGPAAVLAHDVRVERGAKLKRSVVLAGTRIGKATRWQDRLIYRHGSFDVTQRTPHFELSNDPEELSPTLCEPLADKLSQVLDSTMALIGLVLLSPLLLLVALLIYVDDPGPVIYTQLRVGQDRKAFRLGSLRGRVFELYKFRTMCVDADRKLEELKSQNQYGSGAFFKMERDPRITRIGHFLRKTSLDELPQLINVVLGDMRLVGNRPLPVYEAEALSEDWQRIRFACPAGITGLWQISGRSDLSEKERMVLDSYYSVTRTVWTDWVILAKTVPALLLRRGAR